MAFLIRSIFRSSFPSLLLDAFQATHNVRDDVIDCDFRFLDMQNCQSGSIEPLKKG